MVSGEEVSISQSQRGITIPPGFRISVLVPVYNECATIARILDRVKQSSVPKEVVVVDDASTDGTVDYLKSLESKGDDGFSSIKIFYHEKNRGKGAALRTALAHATGNVIVVQDADLEYDPRDYIRMLVPILEGNADVVYGSRFLGSDPHRVLFFWHYIGNRLLTFFSNMMTNLNLSDMETGMKVFKKEVLAGIQIRSNRFAFEPEITAKVAKGKWRVYEVGVSYCGRDYSQGKKIRWTDGLVAVFAILRFKWWD